MAKASVEAQIIQLGGSPREREGYRTDNGNLILDVERLDLSNPEGIEQTLNNIPGVVENGVFWKNRPLLTLIGQEGGVVVRGRAAALERYAKVFKTTSILRQIEQV